MFGYVSVDKSSLRLREYDYYRATYCGLCHSMGKCTGCLSRMTLSYDMTFVALLREAIADTPVEFEKKRCVRHPFRARRVVKGNAELEYSAYVSGILTANKIDDNIDDERGMKRFSARVCRAFFGKMRRRSVAFSSEICGEIRALLKKLKAVEDERVRSVDIPADIFGQICAYLLSFGFEGERKLVAEKIGHRVGRWIYMVDAIDDYAKDRKSGSYNPFVELYAGADFDGENLVSLSAMLEAELAQADAAFDLIDTDSDINRQEIIKNVLRAGMPQQVKKVLYPKRRECKNE